MKLILTLLTICFISAAVVAYSGNRPVVMQEVHSQKSQTLCQESEDLVNNDEAYAMLAHGVGLQ